MQSCKEEIHFKNEWKELGYIPKTGEKPFCTKKRYGGGKIQFYSKSQVRPLRKKTKPVATLLPMTIENVLRACWTVNRTAKRYRDAASSCYQRRVRGFVSTNKLNKEKCYALKDKALRWLIANSAIKPIGLIVNLTVWQGDGYTFHSLIGPENISALEGDTLLYVEAKKKTIAEMKLIDAEALIDALPNKNIKAMITRSFPERLRQSPNTDDENDWEEDLDSD